MVAAKTLCISTFFLQSEENNLNVKLQACFEAYDKLLTHTSSPLACLLTGSSLYTLSMSRVIGRPVAFGHALPSEYRLINGKAD